jgi:hypothetical protein
MANLTQNNLDMAGSLSVPKALPASLTSIRLGCKYVRIQTHNIISKNVNYSPKSFKTSGSEPSLPCGRYQPWQKVCTGVNFIKTFTSVI